MVGLADDEPVFYALNLDTFEQIIDELKASEFVPTVFEDGEIEGEYIAKDDGALLLSVPYNEGWDVTVNGVATELASAADKGLSCLNVQKGTNKIVMTCKTPGGICRARNKLGDRRRACRGRTLRQTQEKPPLENGGLNSRIFMGD